MIKPRPWQRGALGAATLAWALLGTTLAGATELSQVIAAALAHDSQLAVAAAQRSHAEAKKEQAAALWRPHVNASAVLGLAAQNNQMNGAQFSAPGLGTSSGVDFATSVKGGAMARATVGVVQPLVNKSLQAGREQLMGAARMGELGWDLARQNTLLGTAQSYWELALAQERVKQLQLQMATLERQQEEAQDRFKLGASPITDTYEARATWAQAKAQWTAAALDVKVRQQALENSTGLADLSAQMPELVSAEALPVKNLDDALTQAGLHNRSLRLQRQTVALAKLALAKAQAQSGLRVDLVAEASYETLNGSGDFGQANNKASRAMVGVQANWALYSGGMDEAKALDAAKALEVEQAKLLQVTQAVEQELRTVWGSWDAEQARLQALQQAAMASKARLDATLLGRQVGDRTQLDVLNAQNADVAVALSLAEARVALRLLPLRLKALMGQLDASL